jgi:hypothetical protein
MNNSADWCPVMWRHRTENAEVKLKKLSSVQSQEVLKFYFRCVVVRLILLFSVRLALRAD